MRRPPGICSAEALRVEFGDVMGKSYWFGCCLKLWARQAGCNFPEQEHCIAVLLDKDKPPSPKAKPKCPGALVRDLASHDVPGLRQRSSIS